MAETLDWQPSNAEEVLHRLVQHATAGQLIVLATESTYEVATSALHPEAVRQLASLAAPGEQPALVLTSLTEVFDWLPFIDGLGLRFLRRLTPAQWQLQGGPGLAFGLLPRLPATVQELLAPERQLTLRWPELALWSLWMRQLRGPLVSVPLYSAVTAEQAVQALGGRNAVVIDTGPCPLGQPPTLVQLAGNSWQVRREGSLSAAQIAAAAPCQILFVCTGNTCRSPMAAALCSRLLADKLGCAPEDLPRRGFLVQSAGLAAMIGEEAAPEALTAVQELGADLTPHRSQSITGELLTQADLVFTMTASHLYALQGTGLVEGHQLQMLSPTGQNVADPLGGEPAVYQACAQEILGYLRQRLPHILQAS
jgi:protein-tyrosine phosphatase